MVNGLGPRPHRRGLVLAGQHRGIHPTADCGHLLAPAGTRPRFFASAAFLFALPALLRCAKPGEAGALGVGQHQSSLLLVCRLRAPGCADAGYVV